MFAVCMALIDDSEDICTFNGIVESYEKKLYGYAVSILHSSALAEEAVWETFSSIAKSFDRFKKGSIRNTEAYLMMTLKNKCRRIFAAETKHSSSVSIDDLPETQVSFEELNRFEIKDLTEAMQELRDEYKTVIAYMCYYEYSADHTAQVMGVSRSTVYKYLNTAKKILCEKLGEYHG